MTGSIQQEIVKARPISKTIIKLFVKLLKYTSGIRRINPFAAGVYTGGFLFLPPCQILEWTVGCGGIVAALHFTKVALFAFLHH